MKRRVKIAISLAYHVVDRLLRWSRGLLGRPSPGRCVGLYYHSVPKQHREVFARQMDALVQFAQPLDAGFRGRLEPGKHCAAVTFDDAFVSVGENAIPVLTERRIPSTVFAPTALLGKSPGWEMEPGCPDEEATVMSATELGALDDRLVTIGSHTRTHPRLPALPAEDARQEIAGSRQDLESLLGRPVRLFAFPYGEHDEATVALCREAGYDRVFLITPGMACFGSEDYAIPRVPVDASDGPLEFRLKLAGAYSWMPWASSLKRRLGGERR